MNKIINYGIFLLGFVLIIIGIFSSIFLTIPGAVLMFIGYKMITKQDEKEYEYKY